MNRIGARKVNRIGARKVKNKSARKVKRGPKKSELGSVGVGGLAPAPRPTQNLGRLGDLRHFLFLKNQFTFLVTV